MLTSSWFKDAEKLKEKEQYDKDVRVRWHPAGTDRSAVITHELGHSLDAYLSQRNFLNSSLYLGKNNHDASKYFSGILRHRVCKAMHIKVTDWDAMGREVSRYCAKYKDDTEWFADCFAEAMHSPHPRPMATEMMKQLKQILKEEGLM